MFAYVSPAASPPVCCRARRDPPRSRWRSCYSPRCRCPRRHPALSAPPRPSSVSLPSAAVQRVGARAATDLVIEARADDPLDAGERIPLCIAAEPHAAVVGDEHCRGDGLGVVRGIEALRHRSADPTSQPAAQHIITRAAIETVGEVITAERIVERRAGDAFDIAEDVARRIAADAYCSIERDLNRSIGARIIGNIVADAAVELGPRLRHPGENIVTSAAGENVRARIASQGCRYSWSRSDSRRPTACRPARCRPSRCRSPD
jgi:hypothetical protein